MKMKLVKQKHFMASAKFFHEMNYQQNFLQTQTIYVFSLNFQHYNENNTLTALLRVRDTVEGCAKHLNA